MHIVLTSEGTGILKCTPQKKNNLCNLTLHRSLSVQYLLDSTVFGIATEEYTDGGQIKGKFPQGTMAH